LYLFKCLSLSDAYIVNVIQIDDKNVVQITVLYKALYIQGNDKKLMVKQCTLWRKKYNL